jgi:hypothetical protein
MASPAQKVMIGADLLTMPSFNRFFTPDSLRSQETKCTGNQLKRCISIKITGSFEEEEPNRTSGDERFKMSRPRPGHGARGIMMIREGYGQAGSLRRSISGVEQQICRDRGNAKGKGLSKSQAAGPADRGNRGWESYLMVLPFRL